MTKQDFDQVYAEHKDNVWRIVSRYVFLTQDREDLFQEIFINIHKGLGHFKGKSALSTWIYRIAVNTAINHVKKQNRYKWFKNLLTNFRVIEAEELKEESDVSVLKPLARLNPDQRMILLLAEVEDKKLGEIAELMKLPLGTVKSNLHRAREILKKEVNKHGEI